MAATAGSVAVGSTIGHGLSSMLFGGRSEAAPAPAPEAAAPVNQNNGFARGVSCENQAKEFTLCLEKAPYESCTYYLEQLKAVSHCFSCILSVIGFADCVVRNIVPGCCCPILDFAQ